MTFLAFADRVLDRFPWADDLRVRVVDSLPNGLHGQWLADVREIQIAREYAVVNEYARGLVAHEAHHAVQSPGNRYVFATTPELQARALTHSWNGTDLEAEPKFVQRYWTERGRAYVQTVDPALVEAYESWLRSQGVDDLSFMPLEEPVPYPPDILRHAANFWVGRTRPDGTEDHPRVVFLHSTRGGRDDGADFQRTVNHFARAETPASTHLVIGHEGELARMVQDANASWHAGDQRGPMNLGALSIEIAQELPTTPYTEQSVARTALETAKWCKLYSIPVERLSVNTPDWWTARGIVDHETYSLAVTHHGKTDPGDLWPWDHYLDLVRMELARMGGQTPPAPVPPADADSEAALARLDALERRVLTVEAELENLRQDLTGVSTRLGRVQNGLLGAGKAQ